MLYRNRQGRRGFTLIELAIVLGVAGLLFGGLWRLLSTGNSQMRDQATASQQAQLATAVNNYLQTAEGQAYMAAIAASGTAALALPSSSGNAAGTGGCSTDGNMATTPTHAGLCNFLPPGFYVNTPNPYGQIFTIGIKKDSTLVNTAPKTYSFMILTTGGDTISDTSGGRISAMIGGDGGFVYGTDVCTSGSAYLTTACGAYGSWSTLIKTYFAADGTAGHIASRTYYSPLQSLGDYWLARQLMPGDSATTPFYNTMKTPLLLGGKTFYLGTDTSLTTGGGTISAQGGTVDLGTNGIIQSSIGTYGAANFTIYGKMTGGGNPSLSLYSNCNKATYGDNTCSYIANVTGDMNVTNFLAVSSLYAGNFVYNNSDIRLKKNIKQLSDPLSDIMKLRPVSFQYKKNDQANLGVIAQELEKVYPELVTDGPTGMKGVSYEGLIAPLIGAVQQLKGENDNLRDRLRIQDERQEKLDKEIEAMRKAGVAGK